MKRFVNFAMLVAVLGLLAGGCGSNYHYTEPAYTATLHKGTVLADTDIDPALEGRILALDPDHVTAEDVRDVLSKCPAPHMVNIHGGVWPVYQAMESFGKFLVSMGYPEGRVRRPGNGDYSFSCYKSATEIAGAAAWYYEHEGMRPIIVGHSQGGMQALKVLHELAGDFHDSLRVYNPLSGRFEDRDWIIDPFTGERTPVVGGVKVSYASAVGAGGMTRFMPNQWNMAGKLRTVPDSVIEFTGLYSHGDFLGGDLLGFGDGNDYHPEGSAHVRTVLMPASHTHYFVPYTYHLAKHKETRDWINDYVQTDRGEVDKHFDVNAANIVWAADVSDERQAPVGARAAARRPREKRTPRQRDAHRQALSLRP